AAVLARALRIPAVLVPRMPGALSALGLLFADAARDYSRTLLVRADRTGLAAARGGFRDLEARAARDMAAEGIARRDLSLERSLDLRYAGQSYELEVPAAGDPVARFEKLHEKTYGHASRGRAVELVNVRLHAAAPMPPPRLPKPARARPG